MKVSQLKPDQRNANKGTERGRKLVRESLKRYGAGRSILLDKAGNIIAGNKTAEGAAAVGMDDMLVVKSDGTKLVAVQRTDLDINDKKARELAIADNRASEVGLDWDLGVMQEFEIEGVDLSPFWDERELVQFFARTTGEAPEPKLDQAAELQKRWATETGQLWLIGRHRLLCGDSTSEPDLRKLLYDQKAAVVITDPPYNVGYKYGEGTDDEKGAVEYMMWCRQWFQLAKKHTSSCVVLTTGITNLPMWISDIERTHRVIAWVKENQCSRNYIGATSGFNVWEPVLVYGKAKKCVPRDSFSEPIAIQSDTGDHPCPKPLAAWKWLVENFSEQKDMIYDPFLGSGTTMVAAQQLNRTCYGIEIEPRYVAVALERLADMGLKPELADAR